MIFNIKDFTKYSKTLIETGTSAGAGVQRAIDAGYKLIVSAEADKNIFETTAKKFKRYYGDTYVDLRWGMSTDVLPNVLSYINSTAVIFLDAHPSGPNSFGHNDVIEKGNDSEFAQDKIIKAELNIIFKYRNDHLIIIDDVNGVNAESKSYMSIMKTANPNYTFQFYDENMGILYKEKLLVAIP